MEFHHVNFLAVGSAAIAAWIIGALWYSPLLFGKVWQKELGKSDEDFKEQNLVKIFGLSFVFMFIMGLGLALILAHMDGPSWKYGMHMGAMIGCFVVASSIAINYLYQRQSLKLWLIDAGYQLIFMTIMGIIIGAWR